MKINQMSKIACAAILAGIFAMTSCSSEGKKQESGHDGHQQETAVQSTETSVAVTLKNAQAGAVYEHYLHLKNALVKSDAKEAQAGAAALQTAFSEAGNTKGADLAGKIASSTDIKAQRAEFEALTAEAEAVVRSSGVQTGAIYKQYCPMANEDNGGYWLSSNSDIKNPYFGDEMLTCGETKEEIK